MKNTLFRSTKFFPSDLLCPSDWKLHYLYISPLADYLTSLANIDLLKWVLLLPVPVLGLEMGVCSRESPLGLWSPEVGRFSNNCIALPDTAALMPECSDACSFHMDIKRCLPQCSHFYCWNMTLQNTQPWCLEPFSCVCSWVCTTGLCLAQLRRLCPLLLSWSSGASVSIPPLWLSIMGNLNGKLKVM